MQDYLNELDGDSDDGWEELANGQASNKNEKSREKNRKKKNRKKQNRQKRMAEAQKQKEEAQEAAQKENSENNEDEKESNKDEENVEIEYIPEKFTIADLPPMYRQFYRVFESFKLDYKLKEAQQLPISTSDESKSAKKLAEKDDSDDEMENDPKKDDKDKISKRMMKKLTRLSVAELKQIVQRPDVVEMHDVTARDPRLLIQLKAHRNTVQGE